MNTIKLLVRELEDDTIGGDCDERHALLGDISNTIERANARIETLTEYSKTVEPEQSQALLDINALVRTILNDLQHDITQSGASIKVEPLGQYRGNEFQIRMLLQNLIANALKYHQPNTAPRIHIRGDVATGADPYQLIFEVEDNGIGIAPEHRQRVFALFKRLHDDAEYESSGLGLAVVKRVVHNNNGFIDLRASPSGGSLFRVDLEGPGGGCLDAP